MKSLHIYKIGTPNGDIDFKIAFNGKLIAIKGNENSVSHQFIEQYRQKGAKVLERRDGVVVDIFTAPNQTLFKLGQIEIDMEKDSEEIIENKLCQFYIDTFSKAGFNVD